MIPKIIHYCWFGKGLMPQSQKKCIEGWKKLMPDYEIKRWDESTFDLDKYPLAKYACEVKKYALASDVCRYNVLTEYGGIYLDTDVELFKRFDDFLDCNFFSGIELYNEFFSESIQEKYLNEDGTAKDPTNDVPRLEILTSSMACRPGHPMIRDIRDYYNSVEASPERALHYRDWVNNDRLVARYLTKYGFRYKDETQYFGDGMVVYGTGTFGYAFSPNPNYTVSYHHNAATWESEKWNRAQKLSFFFDKIGLLPIYNQYKKAKKSIKRKLNHLLHPVQGELWCLHRVVPQRSQYPSNRELEITPTFLEAEILQYRKAGYSFVSIDEILSKQSSLLPQKRVNITFDDGFKDVYENAFPIIKKYKIPFTLYLTTGFPDHTADMWWIQMEGVYDVEGFEKEMKSIYESRSQMREKMHKDTATAFDPFICEKLSLSWDEIREMVESGLCTVGSHSATHPGLTRLDTENAKQELSASKARIEALLGIEVKHFSYPHSMQDSEIQSFVEEAGYASAALGYGGKIRIGDNRFCLNRKHLIQP